MPARFPKRDEERRRRNKPDDCDHECPIVGVVMPPPVDGEWHPIAHALVCVAGGVGAVEVL